MLAVWVGRVTPNSAMSTRGVPSSPKRDISALSHGVRESYTVAIAFWLYHRNPLILKVHFSGIEFATLHCGLRASAPNRGRVA